MQAGRGGQVIIFQSTPPSAFPAPSALISSAFPSLSSSPLPSTPTVVEESSLYGTDDEKKLYLPRNKAWQALAEECAEEGVGISVFLGNARSVDVGSIGTFLSFGYPYCPLPPLANKGVVKVYIYNYCFVRRVMLDHRRRNILPPAVRSRLR